MRLGFTTALAVLLAIATTVQAQTDNFDSGSDAAWQLSTTAVYPSTFSFVPDVFGGQAFRLHGLTPTTSGTAGAQNTARVVAVRPDVSYSTFYVAADLVAWNTNTYDATNEAVIGLIARASSVTAPDQLSGIIFATHYNQYGNAVEGTRGTAQIYGVLQGGGFLIPAAQGNFTINPGHSYRMVFAGTNNVWQGSFYDLQDLTHPLLTLLCDDSYAPGAFPTSGYSGVFGLGYRGTGGNVNDTTSDATFDNFVASTFPPTSVAPPVNPPAVPHGMIGAPQVVNRTPASYANFYSAAGGISFTATTLTTTNAIVTNAIRLFLNGVNVSSSLAITAPSPSTNASVSFSGLAANCWYNARIELLDSYGRRTTNAWTFDTFSDAYLASSAAKDIECEEYDFGGLYHDPSVVSGITTNGSYVNGSDPSHYVDQVGANANPGAGLTPPFDFFDWDTSAHGPLENQFRTSDSVGTENGYLEYAAALGSAVVNAYVFDNLRQKYLAAQPDGSLVECGVERTDGEEWLNYTRNFSSANVYNVYLRHGCGLTQPLSLDQIGAGPTTNNLGTFNCVNALTLGNFCYAPLLDGTGKLATVNLSGVNTVRLTLASPHFNGIRAGMWMNYLAFVPSVPQVYSGAQVKGTYTPEVNMLVDTANKRLTVPRTSGGTMFYRVLWTSQVTITGISLSGGNVVLSYQ